MRWVILLFSLLITAQFSFSATIHVPGDQPTIQAGIDAAVNGDAVSVGPGLYIENISFSGKNIVVISSGETGTAVIQAANPTLAVVSFDSNEPKGAEITGFTIKGSTHTGISCTGSSPTVKNNIITGNSSDDTNTGAGIELTNTTVSYIHGNIIFGNSASVYGCAIHFEGSSNNDMVSYNLIYGSTGGYAEIRLLGTTTNSIIHNNTISATQGACISSQSEGTLIVINNILFFSDYHAVYNDRGSLTAEYNCTFANSSDYNFTPGAGNIYDNAMFIDSANHDYALQSSSPCIDAGDPDPQYNDPDGTRNDMGAFPYNPENQSPVFNPIDGIYIIEGDTVYLTITVSDPDDTIIVLSAHNLPDGAVFTDNGNGTGHLIWPTQPGQIGLYSILFVASDGELTDSLTVNINISPRPPEVSFLTIDGQTTFQNIIFHIPEIVWGYWDYGNDDPLEQSTIAVGTDDDWQYAEMWNPTPFSGPDTSVTYAGAALIDGETYYLRLRVHNGLAWSEWYETSFRMNSLPSVPMASSPTGDLIVSDAHPILYLHNSTDAENDPLGYEYAVYSDSETIITSSEAIEEEPDSTGWMVDVTLDDNTIYLWKARAGDGYEFSDWCDLQSFWVNASEGYPSAFDLIYPPDTGWSQVCDSPTLFWWHESLDNDPFDSIYYRLLVSMDPDFNFVATYDSLYETCCALPEFAVIIDLDYGTHYWWKAYAIDTKGNMTQSSGVADFLTWVLGDANQDSEANVGDAVFLINYVFNSGAEPVPLKVGDINGDCDVNVGDAVYMISYIFSGGDPPQVGCAE